MSTIDIFADRMDYKEFDGSLIGIPKFDDFRDPNPLDFWYKKPFYGRVNEQGEAINIPKEIFAAQDKLTLISDGVYAVDFVVTAFKRLKRRIDNIIALGGELAGPVIDIASVFHSFKPKKGFQSADDMYTTYMNGYFSIFMKRYLSVSGRDEKIRNFNDFLYFFMKFANRFSHELPITKTGFVKSNFCSPLISGLVIEVSIDDHNDDTAKGKYINDSAFRFYHSLAKWYGFYVDKNAPWRLVANLASPRMQQFWIRARPGPNWDGFPDLELKEAEEAALLEETCKIVAGAAPEEIKEWGKPVYDDQIEKFLQPTSVNNFFETYYTKSHSKDIQLLKTKLVDSYNEYVSAFPEIIIEKDVNCVTKFFIDAGGGIKPTDWRTTLTKEIFIRKEVTMSAAWSSIKTTDLFKIYMSMRSQEESANIPLPEFNEILRNALRIFRYSDKKDLDNGATLMYINDKIRGYSKRLGKVLPLIFDPVEVKFLPISSQEYESYVPEY